MSFSISKYYYSLSYRISIIRSKMKLLNLKLKLGKRVKFGINVHIGRQSFIYMGPNSGSLKISNNVLIRDFCTMRIEGNGKLTIGENTFLNSYCSIGCLGQIAIGDNTMFGEGVKIYDTNHNYKEPILIREQGYTIKPVKIGNNCWIGSNTVILAGVQIGDNVVIGANCTIFKNISSNSLVKSSIGHEISNY